MRRRPRAAYVVLTFAISWGGAIVTTQSAAIMPEADPLAFFRPGVVLRPAERRILEGRSPLITLPPARGRELAVFSAIAIDPVAPEDRVTRWMRHIEQFRQNDFVLASGRFSTPPHSADVDGISLDDRDLDDLKDCQPGRCNLKLSRAEIEQLKQAIDTSGDGWREAAQRAFRSIVLARVSAYAAGGHTSLDDYSDHRVARSPLQSFTDLAAHIAFRDRRVSAALNRVVQCPGEFTSPPHGFIYWSKERLGDKTIVSATHVLFVEPDRTSSIDPIVLGVQIFATHYFDASLTVTAIVREPSSSRRYLVHVYRSEIDILDGFWGRLARSIIAARLKKDGPAILDAARQRLTHADPPVVDRRAPSSRQGSTIR